MNKYRCKECGAVVEVNIDAVELLDKCEKCGKVSTFRRVER